ncbi:hypothetical protein D3C81_1315630 [compost metagenome]
MRQRIQLHAGFALDGVDVSGRKVHLREDHLHVQFTQLIDGFFQLARTRFDTVGRFDHGCHFQSELTQQVVVGRVHGCHPQFGVRCLGQFGQGIGAHLAQALAVGAGVLGVGFGIGGIELA